MGGLHWCSCLFHIKFLLLIHFVLNEVILMSTRLGFIYNPPSYVYVLIIGYVDIYLQYTCANI